MTGRRTMRRASIGMRLAALIAAATLLAAVPAQHPRETDAAWADAETASGTFQAMTVPAPVLLGCTAANAVLAASVTFTWTLPAGYATSDVDVYASTSLLSLLDLSILSSVTTTGPVNGVYTTKYSGGLLSNTLGGTVYVGADITSPSGWTSRLAYMTARIPTLLGTGTCTATNPA